MAAALAIYWLLTLAAGISLVDCVSLDWWLAERLAAALVAGVVASTLVSFGLALWWGVGPAAALVAPLLVLAAAVGSRHSVWLARVRQDRGSFGRWLAGEWGRPGARFGIGLAALLLLGLFFIFSRALYQSGGTILAGYPAVWADWGVHAAYAESFHLGHNLPAMDTLEAGTALRYPFMVDFQPALLETLGQNLAGSLDVPSWLVSSAAMVLIWHLAWRVCRRLSAATVALALVLFGGGLGFVGLYGDGCQQLAATSAGFQANSCTTLSSSTPAVALQFVGHLPVELTHLPRSYDGQAQTDPPLPDLQWWEPLLVFWLPQRDFDFGMALVAGLAILLWEAYRGRRRELLLAAGVLGAALPWFNPFGYLAAGLIGLWWLGRSSWGRGLAYFFGPLLVLGLPRMLYVVSGPHGQLNNPVGTNSFPQLDLGWLANAATSCTASQFHSGASCDALYLTGASPLTWIQYLVSSASRPALWGEIAGFWLSNTGIFILVAGAVLLLGLWGGRLLRARDQLELLCFSAPFWLLFLLGNLVVAQPWNWDNTKIFQYWYLGAAIPVAWLLTSTGPGLWRRLAVGLAIGSLLLSGVLSMDMALVGQSTTRQTPPASTTIGWTGLQEEEVARALIAKTSPRAVFLTEGEPYDPVTALAGRTAVLAYDGWLWSYGQPLRVRYAAVSQIYAGCSETVAQCPVVGLLRHYHISYVEFESADYNDLRVNRTWFEDQRLPVVVRTKDYLVLDVRPLWQAHR